MDPIRIIVTALALGAAADHTDSSKQAVTDAYNDLKTLIHRKYAHIDLAVLETRPDNNKRQAIIEEELQKAGADQDIELLQQARRVLSADQDNVLGADAEGDANSEDNKDTQLASNRPPISTAVTGNVGQVGNRTINTRGGTYHEGPYYEAEKAYDVHGQPNPYLGLAAYTYQNRHSYAGRSDKIAETVSLLSRPGDQRNLLFVTGASGSGKSSFAQAGLIPALETHYQQTGRTTRWAVMRPFHLPLAALGDALHTLGIPAEGTFSGASKFTPRIPFEPAPPNQISLLIVDQFEECFTQSQPDQRAAFFNLLANLPSFVALPLHIIATLRSDYLGDLFSHEDLYNIATQGVQLRAMTTAELQEAIQQPIRLFNEQNKTGIRMEDGLLQVLAEDAALDAAYLPLLQVTCEDLWRQGWLKRSAYGTITDAIRQRAETVFQFANTSTGQTRVRTTEEQAEILELLLALVDVSTKDEIHRDVRIRRSLQDLTRGDPQRRQLVDELAALRLLSTNDEKDPETGKPITNVDIIHESLINNWNRLKQAVEDHRDKLQKRARFETTLQEWKSREGQKGATDFLLTGVRLAEAKELDQGGDVALQSKDAKTFLQNSIDQQDRRLRRIVISAVFIAAAIAIASVIWVSQVNNLNQNLQAEVTRSFNAEMRAEEEAALKAAAAATAEARRIEAETERDRADQETTRANARQVAAVAQNRLSTGDPSQALLYGITALHGLTETIEVHNLVRAALENAREITTISGHQKEVTGLATSRDGTMLATASDDFTARVWNLKTFEPLLTVTHDNVLTGAIFSLDNQYLITGSRDNTVTIWRISDGQNIHTLLHPGQVRSIGTHPNGQWLAARVDNQIFLWDIVSGQQVASSPYRAEADIRNISFLANGSGIIAGTNDEKVYLWDIETGQFAILSVPDEGKGHQEPVTDAQQSSEPGNKYIASLSRDLLLLWTWEEGIGMVHKELPQVRDGVQFQGSVQFSPDGRFLAAGSITGIVRVWDLSNLQANPYQLSGRTGTVISFSPDGQLLALASSDGSIELWNSRTKQTTLLTKAQEGNVSHPVFSRDGQTLFTTDQEGNVRLWRVSLGGNSSYSPSPFHPISTFSSSNDNLIIGGEQGLLSTWNLQTGENHLHQLTTERITAVAASPSANLVAIGDATGTISIVDLNTEEIVSQWKAHPNPVHTLTFLSDSNLLASAGGESKVRIWQWQTGRQQTLLLGHSNDVNALALTQEDNLLTASSDGSIRTWNWQTGQEAAEPLRINKPLTTLATNADGYIAAADTTAHTYLWTPQGNRRTFTSNAPIRTLIFNQDLQLLGGNEIGEVQIWDLQNPTSRSSVNIVAHNQTWIKGLALTFNNRLLLSTGDDGLIKFWPLDTADLLQVACQRVNRPLTVTEWQQAFSFALPANPCENQQPSVEQQSPVTAQNAQPPLDLPNLPIVYYFEATTGSTVQYGSQVTLRWNADNATAIYLQINDEPPLGVAGSESRSYNIVEETTFRLLAQNLYGERSQFIKLNLVSPPTRQRLSR